MDTDRRPTLEVTPEWLAKAQRARQRDDGSRVTYLEIADAVGTSEGTAQRVLTGKFPTSKWVVPISRYLGVPTSTELAAGMTEPLQANELSRLAPELERLNKDLYDEFLTRVRKYIEGHRGLLPPGNGAEE